MGVRIGIVDPVLLVSRTMQEIDAVPVAFFDDFKNIGLLQRVEVHFAGPTRSSVLKHIASRVHEAVSKKLSKYDSD